MQKLDLKVPIFEKFPFQGKLILENNLDNNTLCWNIGEKQEYINIKKRFKGFLNVKSWS